MKRLLLSGLTSSQREQFAEQLCLSQINDVKSQNIRIICYIDEIEDARQLLGASDAVLVLVDPSKQDFCWQLQNLYEQFRSLTVIRHMFVLCIGTNYCGATISLIAQSLTHEQNRWNSIIDQEIEQLKNKPYKGNAVEERMVKLERWRNQALNFDIITAIYNISQNDATNDEKENCFVQLFSMMKSVSDVSGCYFSLHNPSYHNSVEKNDINTDILSSKPPALHWTNWPRDDEVQLTWRFSQPCIQISNNSFQNLMLECQELADNQDCEYEFRWSDGVLLRFEPIKICILRQNKDLEVSGRIDPDEMADPEDDPCQLIWKHLGSYLKIVFQLFDSFPRLPYQLYVIPIGSIFYEKTINNGEHAFHLSQLLSIMEKTQHPNISFKEYREQNVAENSVNTNFVFPGFSPRTLRDIRQWLRQEWPNNDNSSTLNIIKSTNGTGDRKFSCAARFLTIPDSGGLPNANPLCRRRGSSGRRVSFGTISIEGSKIAAIDNSLPSTQSTKKDLEEMVDLFASNLVNDCFENIFVISD